LKIIKRNKEPISAKRIPEGLSGTGLWTEIKQILGHHNTLPNTVDDIEGGFNITDIFQKKYKSHYIIVYHLILTKWQHYWNRQSLTLVI